MGRYGRINRRREKGTERKQIRSSSICSALNRSQPREAHPGEAMKTNKAAALAKFLERKLQEPTGLASVNPKLVELAVKNAKQTVQLKNQEMALYMVQMTCGVISFLCYLVAYMYVSKSFKYPPGNIWLRIKDFVIAIVLWFFFVCGVRGLNYTDSQFRVIARRINQNTLISSLARLGALVFQLIGDILFPACSTFLPDKIPKEGGVEMCTWIMAAIFFASLATVDFNDYGFGNMVQSICLALLYVSVGNNIATLFVVTSICCTQRIVMFTINEVEIWMGRGLPNARKERLRIVGELEQHFAVDGAADREQSLTKLKRLKEELEKLE